MKTRDFIKALRRSPEKSLLFANANGDAIHRGYHLTEIKAVSNDTVDCGGQKNRWNETILQLWVPASADDDYMPAGKFVSIYDKVCKLVSLDEDAEIRIEYGDETFFPTAYHVANVTEGNKDLRVVLEPPAATCKARDRARNAKSESCCS
jgi:Family of unknown function (DUF6428)